MKSSYTVVPCLNTILVQNLVVQFRAELIGTESFIHVWYRFGQYILKGGKNRKYPNSHGKPWKDTLSGNFQETTYT